MNGFLKQSTASQVRRIGPFVDDTDYKTAETGLAIANTDIKLSKNGGSSANKNSGGASHDVNGMYAVTWDATDTATVGELSFSIKVAGALPVFGTYVVVEEAVYDALFGASAPGYVANAPVNVAQFGGANGTFASGRPEVNASHVGGTSQTGRDIGARLSATATATGTVQSDGGNSATQFKTDLTQTADDHFKDCLVKITSGALAEQLKKCTGYNGTTKILSFTSGFTGAPSNGVTFEIVND